MAKQDNTKEFVEFVFTHVGGKENIVTHSSCSTRLRLTFVDDNKVDEASIKASKEVMATQWKGSQFQIVLGPKASRIYHEFSMQLGQSDETVLKGEKKKFSFNMILDALSGCLAPTLPAILGGGLLKGFLSLFVMLKILDSGGDLYFMLSVIADAPFYFLPFLVAWSASRKFNTSTIMALSIAGMLVHANVVNNAGEVLYIFGVLPVTLVKYTSSIIPIILSVWVMKYVYKWVNDHMPDFLRMLFVPIVVFLVMGFISLGITGPIGYYLGVYVAKFIEFIFNLSPILAGFIIGATRQFVVFTGMHLSLTPIILANLETLGSDYLLPAYGISTLSVAGACLGVYFKSKVKETKAASASAGLSAALGITEPGLYAVMVRFRKPFIASAIGGGIGSAIAAAFGASGYEVSTPSLISLAIYGDSMALVAICMFISFAIAFALTYILGFDETATKDDRAKKAEKKLVIKVNQDPVDVFLPVSGEVIPLSRVQDETIAKGLLGSGIGITPSEGTLYAPVSARVNKVFDGKHALLLETESGEGFLLHIGIDTVDLKGEGFDIRVKEGQMVQAGDVLGSFDLKEIVNKGYDPVVTVILAEGGDVLTPTEFSPGYADAKTKAFSYNVKAHVKA